MKTHGAASVAVNAAACDGRAKLNEYGWTPGMPVNSASHVQSSTR